MNVPDEAVEAAVAAIKNADGMKYDEFFTDFGAPELARLVLEAAAPYLMAQAWDAGMAAEKLQAAIIRECESE